MTTIERTDVADLSTGLARIAQADQLTPDDTRRAVAVAVWRVFHQHEHESVRGRVGPIPYSLKVAKLRPLLEQWFGPDPAGA